MYEHAPQPQAIIEKFSKPLEEFTNDILALFKKFFIDFLVICFFNHNFFKSIIKIIIIVDLIF
jgi:hypothetical protein